MTPPSASSSKAINWPAPTPSEVFSREFLPPRAERELTYTQLDASAVIARSEATTCPP